MFLVGILSWWYGRGWVGRVGMINRRLRSSIDTFSIGLLFRTLFNPFRQISADATGKSFSEKIRALFDKLLSRVIGFIVRSFMIVFGLLFMLLQTIFGVFILIAWLAIPLLPIIGLIVTVIGWVPQWTI